jgi:arginine exporter protein ArgO
MRLLGPIVRHAFVHGGGLGQEKHVEAIVRCVFCDIVLEEM